MKISIWTGLAFEHWGPPSVDHGGIGGSETAAVRMAHHLACLGHEVTMFGDHEGFSGPWTAVEQEDGHLKATSHVSYVPFREAIANPSMLDCDVFVSSRDKTTLRLLKPSSAKVRVLWVHDVHVGDDWESEVTLFDRIYCLTNWHKRYFCEMYPHVDEAKVVVTRNGIEPERFADLDWVKKGPSFVYSSSPDRGLDILLDTWPSIREFCPEAALRVFYGFENMRKLALQQRNQATLKLVDYMQGRVDSMVDEGVIYVGRIGQAELARFHREALVWYYPTAFFETSCITALEAQAAGCAVVSTKLAGLAETASMWPLISGRNKSAEYQRSALDQVKLHLSAWKVDKRDNAGQPPPTSKAVKAREWAMGRTWAGVAAEWTSDFEALLAGKGST